MCFGCPHEACYQRRVNADRAGLGRNKYFEHECIVVFLCCLVYIGMHLIQRFLSESVVNLNHVLQCGRQIDMFRMSSDCKYSLLNVFLFLFNFLIFFTVDRSWRQCPARRGLESCPVKYRSGGCYSSKNPSTGTFMFIISNVFIDSHSLAFLVFVFKACQNRKGRIFWCSELNEYSQTV